jgi:hypothetical protein
MPSLNKESRFWNSCLQQGARKLLQAAIENEVVDYIQFQKDRLDENGQRLVVRNKHLPEREVISGVGPIQVRQARVRHRDKGRFFSAILPKYMRRAHSVDTLTTGHFSLAKRRSQWALGNQYRPVEEFFTLQPT